MWELIPKEGFATLWLWQWGIFPVYAILHLMRHFAQFIVFKFQHFSWTTFAWSKLCQIQDKSNSSNNEGPTQRASALAALNTAFNSTSSPKPVTAPRGQGQRAAAVAALSSVLTAEKRSPESSPGRRLRSPRAEASPTGISFSLSN